MKNLKLCLVILCISFITSPTLHAQKAKFKSKTCTVQKTRLPINYVEPESRTYSLYAKGSYATNVDAQEKRIYGWTKEEANPNLKGVVSIYGFTMSRPSKKSQKKEKKDDDGKVVDRWTEYYYEASAKGRGTLYVYGLTNPFEYSSKNKKKSKYEQKKEAEKAKEKEDLEDNPFLSSEDIEEAEESDVSEDAGLDSEELQLVNTISIDQTKAVKTKNHRSSSAAYKEYTDHKRPQLYAFKSKYPDAAYKNAVSRLNYLYGYTPVNSRFSLRKMKSEKHNDFKKWNDACQATQTLFKTFKYNKSIDKYQTKFDPIIDYFGGFATKISDSDKKAKKMKKAAFQNVVNILFYLDRHDEVISWCNKHKDSKVLDKTAKRMLERAERQKAFLAFHHMTTCHYETTEELADDDEIEVEESTDEEADRDKK